MENQTLPYLGLSPQLVEKILQNSLCPEAKLVLMTMCHQNITETTLLKIGNCVQMMPYELDTARAVLSAERINISRHPGLISFSNEWKDEVQRNAQLQGGITSAPSDDEDDDQSGDSEGSSSEGERTGSDRE
jgi:hypothetical protein